MPPRSLAAPGTCFRGGARVCGRRACTPLQRHVLLEAALHALDKAARVAEPNGVLLLGYDTVGALAHLEIQRRWPGLAIDVVEAFT